MLGLESTFSAKRTPDKPGGDPNITKRSPFIEHNSQAEGEGGELWGPAWGPVQACSSDAAGSARAALGFPPHCQVTWALLKKMMKCTKTPGDNVGGNSAATKESSVEFPQR